MFTNPFRDVREIITHRGRAHRDEFVGCSLILAQAAEATLRRRDVLPDELENPRVAVVDEGERHQPHLLNFDHHQLPRDAAATCSLSLILHAMGVSVDALVLWPWLHVTEVLDSKGLKVASKMTGATPGSLDGWSSPVEEFVLHDFSMSGVIPPGSSTHGFMRRFGSYLITNLRDQAERLQRLDRVAKVSAHNGVKYVQTWQDIEGTDDPELAFDAWRESRHPDLGVRVTSDDRGPGLSLYRWDDHPRVDFLALKDHPDVLFAHPNGSVAKTSRRDVNLAALLDLAIAPEPAPVGRR